MSTLAIFSYYLFIYLSTGAERLSRGFYLACRLGVLSIVPEILEISVGIQMERSVAVFSDRNIRDHLWRWSTYRGAGSPSHDAACQSSREFSQM